MPFDGEFDAIYERLIGPALRDAGYEVERADSDLAQHNVMRGIVERIARADLIVAELTSRNPNVLYELGLAHGLGRPTVLIAQDIDEIPFDLRTYRAHAYSTRFDEIQELGDALRRIGEEHARGNVVFGSPVSDFLVPREQGLVDRVTGEESASEDDAPGGFIDRLVEIQHAADAFQEIIARITLATDDVGEDVTRSGKRMEALNTDTPGAAITMRRLASAAGSDLARYADRLDNELPGLDEAVSKFVDNGLGHVTWLAAQEGDEAAQQMLETRDELSTLLEVSDESLPQLEGFREAVLSVRGFSRDLDKPVNRVAATLKEVSGLLGRVRKLAEDGIGIIDGAGQH